VPLVLESHGNLIVGERPQVLAELIVEFPIPLGGEEGYHLVPAGDRLVTVSPHGIDAVGLGDRLGVASIPGVFGGLYLAGGGFGGERWDGVTGLGHVRAP